MTSNEWNKWDSMVVTSNDYKLHIVDTTQDVDTEQFVKDRINNRFSIMNRMVRSMISGNIRSLIISGAPGVGKTFDVERIIKGTNGLYSDFIKGTISAVGLYTSLYNAKDGGVVILDDCDSVFADEQSLNILKAALDSSDVRTISWRKASKWLVDECGDSIPNTFEFKGGIIFITNIDFAEKIEQNSKMSPHFEALMSRSMYLDLTLKSVNDKYIRIKDIFLTKMASSEGLKKQQAEEIMAFVRDNKDKFIELSLRTVKHIAQLYKVGHDWKDIVSATKFKE